MIPRLEIVVEGDVRYFELPEGIVTLGSSAGNDLVIVCSGVSREHATVERRGDVITISDSGSKNGLVVAGRRVSAVTLAPGIDVILGKAIIRLGEVDTGDAELAVIFDAINSGDEAVVERITETTSTTSDVAARLLRWVRHAERGAESRSKLFAEARGLLGATTLMIVKGGAVVEDISGAWPPPEALQELDSTPIHWIVSEHGDAVRVCAYYPEGPSRSRWRSDYLRFVGETLERLPLDDLEEEAPELIFPGGIVRGTSPAMSAVYEQVRQAIRSDMNVLLLGENGSGKDAIARLIHASDRSRTGRFVAVNTAAVPASLLEAELFGVVAGTATDVKERLGAFRSADRGTIYLDEIAEMLPVLQAKLLRMVEDHAVTPLGASNPEPVDVRIISATNKNPQEQVSKGAFRQDLLFRLNGITITIPPLRARVEDVPELVNAFVETAMRRYQKRVRGISINAMDVMLSYPWPGNVRELQHVVERAVLASPPGGAIEAHHITAFLQPHDERVPSLKTLRGRRTAAETTGIEDALRAAGGNRAAAAKILGISRAALYKRLGKLGITKRDA